MTKPARADLPPPAVSSSVVGAVTQLVARAGAGLIKRLKADHTTIHERRYRADQGNAHGFKVHVACAPAKRGVSASLTGAREDVDAFAAEVFGGVPPSPPEIAHASIVRYATLRSDGAHAHVVDVHGDGLVEVLWQILSVEDIIGEPAMDLDAVARPVARLATATRSSEYRRIFGLSRLRSRLDWHFSLNAFVTTASGSLHWKHLSVGNEIFDPWGGSPPLAPITGYASEVMRNRRRVADPSPLVAAAIGGLAESNGVAIPPATLKRVAARALGGRLVDGSEDQGA